jgi:hypothetical protein
MSVPAKPPYPMIKTVAEITREIIHERMLHASLGIGQAVVPIYGSDLRPEREGRADYLGSGVLTKRNAEHFLVTAAHVLDHNQHTALYIPAQKKLLKLEGSGLVTSAPNGKRENDRVDFAVIKLTAGAVEALGAIRYVTDSEFSKSINDLTGHGLMLLGYPISKNKKIDHPRRLIHAKKRRYAGTALKDDRFAKKLGISGDDHLFVRYEKLSKLESGETVNSFHPQGMSGGALIDLGNTASLIVQGALPKGNFRVVGIFIEYHKAENRLVFVKTDTILGAL